MRVYVCEPGWESPLRDELRRARPGESPEIVSRGWVEVAFEESLGERLPPMAFARQCLPRAVALEAPSVRRWGEECALRIMDELRDHDGAWRLHVFSVVVPGGTAGPRRCSLIRSAIVEVFRKKQRRLLRTLVDDPFASWREEEHLVQVGLRSAEVGYFSHAVPADRVARASTLSRFPGGIVEVAEDRSAPARAYRKLREAFLHADRGIEAGRTVVDLGSSPGGWAHVALASGACVIAVDRSPLDERLMEHPRLDFVRGDAFKFVPDRPVDWLLCDVVAFPDRSIDLLETWLGNRWCRQFCVTLKFRGTDDYPVLDRAKRWLEDRATKYMLRRLSSNKNEVTVLGEG